MREGFTTGSAATAGAKAGAILLLTGERYALVDVPVPPGAAEERRLTIPIRDLFLRGGTATVEIVKDAGDDPDVTHGKIIEVRTRLLEDAPDEVRIGGGSGVGIVTRPGLGLAVGEPAVNPGPKAQIRRALAEVAQALGYAGGFEITVSIPDGALIASKTLNPRLGIVGGISILGTQGVVKPYSLDAHLATIRQGLDVAKAAGQAEIVFSTGRRTEALMEALRPNLDRTAFIVIADCRAFALDEAVKRGFDRAAFAFHIGKLAKAAQGFDNTHARFGPTDLRFLLDLARAAGADSARLADLAEAISARAVFEALADDPARPAWIGGLLRLTAERDRAKAPAMRLEHLLFDFDGTLLSREAG